MARYRRLLTKFRLIMLLVAVFLMTSGFIFFAADQVFPAAQAAIISDLFQGRVYAGEVGDETQPIVGVTVSLYGSNNPYPDPGIFITSTVTDAAGWYGLPVETGFEYYKIIETDPSGYVSGGATTVDGVVQTANWIEYVIPVESKVLTGNKFWDHLTETPTPEPTGVNLIVNDIWPQTGQICFQVQNTGIEPTTHNFTNAFYLNETLTDELVFSGVLEMGERWNGCFEIPWSCDAPADLITVLTDKDGEIAENDETDNGREETWQCDTTAPNFTVTPFVDAATTTSVDVHWYTDELARGTIFYGKSAGRYPYEYEVTALSTEHHITLPGLDPAGSYHLIVESVDSSGNSRTSQEVIFETQPLSDSINPSVSLVTSPELNGEVKIRAEASDNVAVERVEFYIDDLIVFTDYTSPYEMAIDSRLYTNGTHNLTARAFDTVNRVQEDTVGVNVANPVDQTAPQVVINSPTEDQIVSGIVQINASLSDDTGLLTTAFYVDGVYTAFEGFTANTLNTNVSFEWDTTKLTPGQSYRLGVTAYDSEFKSGLDTVDVIVQAAQPTPTIDPPDLVVTNHTVSRFENGFTIALTVKNEGDIDATNICIKDGLKGFQPIETSDSVVDIYAYWDPKGDWGYANICPRLDIPAGQQRIYTYKAVPVLVYPNPPAPAVGWFIDLNWEAFGSTQPYHKYLTLPLTKTTANESIFTAFTLAVFHSNYIIATNPYYMAASFSPNYYANIPNQAKDEINTLLSTMAELAWYKNGVLGYLKQGQSAGTLHSLISPGGDWLLRLNPSVWFTGGGYLLIVGETNIVNAYTSTNWDYKWSDGKVTDVIKFTDTPIANTVGDKRPEWIVGRVIGDSPTALTLPIRTSIQVYNGEIGHTYDNSHALTVSGDGNGEDKMIAAADSTEDLLDTRGYDCDVLHWSDFTTAFQLQAFTNVDANRDILYLFAHGNWNSLGPLQVGSMGSIDFNGTHPFILGASCLTGDYVNGGFVQAIFAEGAGVYIASTELSPMSVNKYSGKYLYTDTLTTNTAGKQFFELERAFWNIGNSYRFWNMEYNYYGDPKYGSTPSNPKLSPVLDPSPPPSTLAVLIPDYQVTTLDGYDQVEIPDGVVWIEDGDYQIPFIQKTLEIPEGFKIQDVHLTSVTSPTYATGFNMPITEMQITQDGLVFNYKTEEGSLPPFAGSDYDWSVSTNPDGSSTLVISIYPFKYSPQTTNVIYYQDYSFDLIFDETPVLITAVQTDKEIYPLGSEVLVDLALKNIDTQIDVGVQAMVKNANSGIFVDGLLVEVLKELEGSASFSLTWDSSPFPAGEYEVEFSLRDSNGFLFDQQSTTFSTGYSEIDVLSFTSNQTDFRIGDTISASLVFQNSGDVAASGTAVIKVLDEQGELITQYEHDYGGLVPTQTIQFTDEWDTTGSANGAYSLVSYVFYDSKSTEPMVISIDSEKHLYLPLITK